MKSMRYLLLIFLVSCTSLSHQANIKKIHIAPNVEMILPAFDNTMQPVEARQMITARHGDKISTLQSVISLKKDHYRLIGLDALGGTLLTIDWTPKNISYTTSPMLPKNLNPANILADFILVSWPHNAIKQSLIGKHIEVKTTAHSRSIYASGTEIVHIEYEYDKNSHSWSGEVHFRNLAWNYILDIHSVDITP